MYTLGSPRSGSPRLFAASASSSPVISISRATSSVVSSPTQRRLIARFCEALSGFKLLLLLIPEHHADTGGVEPHGLARRLMYRAMERNVLAVPLAKKRA